MEKYSIAMSVYIKENPEWFKIAIESMLNQSVKPSDFVIVKDGPLTPELEKVINDYVEKYPDLFNIVSFEKNQGLGLALRAAIEACKYELIARMDSDDYSVPNRIEKELKVLEEHPELSMVGSNVTEFIDNFDNVISICQMPEKNDDIVTFSKKRNPMRHPTLLYKKSAVLKAGNYKDYHLCEDYDIVVRLIRSGCKAYNIQENLVYMRTSEDFYKRRGGLKYLKSVKKFKREMLDTGYITRMQYYKTVIPHIIVCLMPNFLRGFVYKNLLRKKPKNEEVKTD